MNTGGHSEPQAVYMANRKTSIGIVDDSWMTQTALTILLKNSARFDVVFSAGNGVEMIEKIDAGAKVPEILFVDAHMPEMGGQETVRWLTKNYPDTICIGLCFPGKDHERTLMIDAGCTGCLDKSEEQGLYMKALNEVLLNHCMNDNDSDLLSLSHLHHHNEFKINKEEMSIILALFSNKSPAEIAKSTYTTPKTFERKQGKIFRKCNVSSRYELMALAFTKGWVS